MALYEGLESYFKMGEPSGTREDSHGGFSLVEDGNPLPSAPGKFGDGALFQLASGTALKEPTGFIGNPSGSFTISVWLHSDDLYLSSQYIFACYNQLNSRGVWMSTIYSTGLGKRFFYYGGNLISASNWSIVEPREYSQKHIVASFDTVTKKGSAWHNGVKVLDNFDLNFDFANDSMYIGSAFGTSFKYDGVIDEFAMWNRVLTDNEASQLYNGGAGLQYEKVANNKPIFKITNRGIV